MYKDSVRKTINKKVQILASQRNVHDSSRPRPGIGWNKIESY